MRNSLVIASVLFVALSAGAQQKDVTKLPDGSYVCKKGFKHCKKDDPKVNKPMDADSYIFGQLVQTPSPIDAAIPAIQQNFEPINSDSSQSLDNNTCLSTDSKGNITYSVCNITYDPNIMGSLNYEGSFYIENSGDTPIVEVNHIYDMHKQEVIMNSSDFSPNSNIETNAKYYHVIRMSDDEYLKLRQLQAQVDDMKTSILKKYEVNTQDYVCADNLSVGKAACATYAVWNATPDTYEFRGQFILVNVPKE